MALPAEAFPCIAWLLIFSQGAKDSLNGGLEVLSI
jgi:hypothetical protein